MAPNDCYTAALRILNYRFNSEAELRRKLKRKAYDAETVDATIARLRSEKWLDDERFAAAFTRSRVSRRVGRRRIARELEAAGVGADAISRAIAENVDADGEREAIEKLCARRIESLVRRHGRDYAMSEEGRQKIVATLLRSGFETSLVLEVIRAKVR